jgi:hypothetical protein
MFYKHSIDMPSDVFDQLSLSAQLETVAPGRLGAVLVAARADRHEWPIVRTTTPYQLPVQPFQTIHHQIARAIEERAGRSLGLNNAMIEIYDSSYRKMKFHTDQALDLDPDSHIAVFSCYENGSIGTRKLVVKRKGSSECQEIVMDHNSVILFSTRANRNHLHKIVPAQPMVTTPSRWLGITLRASKTWIASRANQVILLDRNVALRLASEEERRQFLTFKSLENSEADFRYPELDYTISASDMRLIKNEPDDEYISTMTENQLLAKHNVLLCLDPEPSEELTSLREHFSGQVLTRSESLSKISTGPKRLVYVCGNLCQLDPTRLTDDLELHVIAELSTGLPPPGEGIPYRKVRIDEVPQSVHGVAIYVKQFFDPEIDYFERLSEEHQFQSLTESNKPGSAFRTGIYLTPVEERGDETHFRLLRCSSNFTGPTDNFRSTDRAIVDRLNGLAEHFLAEKTHLNHVLAQIYQNRSVTEGGTVVGERKARIKEHSDKTEDMPANGAMAFCSFYRNCEATPAEAALTRLRFRLKPDVTDEGCEKRFEVVLHPHSVLLMPLKTNRLYTHEIVPSTLPIDRIPTRMGYVVRCSEREAVHRGGQCFLVKGEGLVPLEPPDEEGTRRLKELYFRENTTSQPMRYDPFYFSLNRGDYLRPIA